MSFQVIDLDTDKPCGVYETLAEAKRCVRVERLRAYEIWSGHVDEDGDFSIAVRFEHCEPYEGDDPRVMEAHGIFWREDPYLRVELV